MKFAKKLLIIGIIQFVLMVLFITLFEEDIEIVDMVTNLPTEVKSKWYELIYAFIPFIVSIVYFFETLYLTRREKIKGTPYNNKKLMMWISEIIFMASSLLSWTRLIIQYQFVKTNTIVIPYMFIFGFILALLIIVAGQLLLRTLREDCLGIEIPFITKDHSIWRRVNVLIGKMLLISGLLLALVMIIYEIVLKWYVVIIGVFLVIILSIIYPLIYGIYLNYKSNKKY